MERPKIILLVLISLALLSIFNLDIYFVVWMKQFPDHLRPLANLVTKMGEGVPVLVGSGLMIILRLAVPVSKIRPRQIAYSQRVFEGATFVFLSVALSGLSALAIKFAIGRARPTLSETQGYLSFQPFAMHSDFAAFPSGHSATAAGMAICFALLASKFRAVFISLGLAICASRQIVGVHWMSDTIAGWAVGAVCTYGLAHVFAQRNVLFSYNDSGRLQVMTRRQQRVDPRYTKTQYIFG